MKKIKLIFVIFTMAYLILAGMLMFNMNRLKANSSNEYRVEIKRLSEMCKSKLDVGNTSSDEILWFDVSDYAIADCVKEISFLSYECINTDTLEKFYMPSNLYQIEIVPVIQDNCMAGYLRFDYVREVDNSKINLIAQICLFVMYLFSTVLFIYVYKSILKPFNRLSSMPYELSRGDLTCEINENRNKYFGNFIWAINMLKDNLENHKKKELKLAKDKKMIILSISHDIKTPLNAINLYAKALENDIYKNEDEKKQAAVRIQRKTAEIDEFINQIIKSSKEEIISIEVNNTEFYLEDFIGKVKKGYSQKCELNKIDFKISEYENILLKGDIERLYEAAGNLIENAFKYGDGKEIRITFTQEEDYLLIHVYNTGEPVKDNEMIHLFDGFFRGSNAKDKNGNGLGLYICREIMVKMNGDIYAVKSDGGMEIVLVCAIC